MSTETVKRLHWLGHDAFRLDGPKTIYIDPFQLPADSPKADIILITHDHNDHFSAEDVALISRPETDFVSIPIVIKKLSGNRHPVKPGDHLIVQGIEIEAVPAYNINKRFHPKDAGHVGYIITLDSERIYHAGDTDLIPEMADLRVQIALLPVSGIYVMTADEAALAAQRIKPELAIPMHFGAIVGNAGDAQTFVNTAGVPARILLKE